MSEPRIDVESRSIAMKLYDGCVGFHLEEWLPGVSSGSNLDSCGRITRDYHGNTNFVRLLVQSTPPEDLNATFRVLGLEESKESIYSLRRRPPPRRPQWHPTTSFGTPPTRQRDRWR